VIRVLIVDDHPIVRRGFKEILADEYPDAEFGEAADSAAALGAFQSQKWDLALLDINLPGPDGLALLQQSRRLHPRTPVLVVSAYPEEEFAVRSFKLGAAGYLGKNQASEELVTAAKRILSGGKYVTASLAERLADELSGDARQTPTEKLSPRELQVLGMVALGRSIKEIAAALSLSEKTIGTYRARITAKTGLTTNVALTRFAIRHGLAM
jgi:DNA-binding NarL/FixJ family response regulator